MRYKAGVGRRCTKKEMTTTRLLHSFSNFCLLCVPTSWERRAPQTHRFYLAASSNHQIFSRRSWPSALTFARFIMAGVVSMYGIATSMTILALVAIALRFYARHVMKIGYSWDDWMMIPAMVCTLSHRLCLTTITFRSFSPSP
jgi:hypothetical protein